MNAVAEGGRKPASKHQVQPEYIVRRIKVLTRHGVAEPIYIARPNYPAHHKSIVNRTRSMSNLLLVMTTN